MMVVLGNVVVDVIVRMESRSDTVTSTNGHIVPELPE